MEDAPAFETAVDLLKRFLSDQGWPSTLVWRSETDIVRGPRCDVVVRRRREGEATSFARAHYEVGRRHGVGIALEVACDLEGVACATVFWTNDVGEAERRLMPERGLKLTIVTPHRGGRSVGLVKWWLARRKARVLDSDLSRLAARPAVAADGASRRR